MLTGRGASVVQEPELGKQAMYPGSAASMDIMTEVGAVTNGLFENTSFIRPTSAPPMIYIFAQGSREVTGKDPGKKHKQKDSRNREMIQKGKNRKDANTGTMKREGLGHTEKPGRKHTGTTRDRQENRN
ncbi:hypothetical protein GBF38_006798 [Nibea albiflora]|uniref:Uncharacterized protein n=1 Tax=Nibea albiflora TaxID=240163 RepID=A0ACB7EGK7_NIBAL|nr:hypothetical protein GBF38_006798 [Nibea albiflora]